MIKTNSPTRENDWNNWYNNVHIPALLHLSGFLSVRRYVNYESKINIFTKNQPKYLAMYELANIDVVRSQAFLKLQEEGTSFPPSSVKSVEKKLPEFSCGVYEQIFPEEEQEQTDTRLLLLAEHAIPPKYEGEYNAWYNTEHIPTIMQVSGFLTARRFACSGELLPIPNRESILPYLTIYDIENEELFESSEFKQRNTSPWTTRIRSLFVKRSLSLHWRIYP